MEKDYSGLCYQKVSVTKTRDHTRAYNQTDRCNPNISYKENYLFTNIYEKLGKVFFSCKLI